MTLSQLDGKKRNLGLPVSTNKSELRTSLVHCSQCASLMLTEVWK